MRFLLLFTLVLASANVNAQNPLLEALRFEEIYIPIYTPANTGREVILTMDYASPVIKNMDAWDNPRNRKVVFEIDLVYTKYPEEKKDWLTNYDSLLNWRLQEIGKLDHRFLRNRFIKWNFILQTDCKTEEQAKRMFHGVVIKYFYRDGIEDKIYGDLRESHEIVYGNRQLKDSTILKVLDRNRQWRDMLVVTDWTATMYPFASQVVLWHRLNQEVNAIKHFSFFNDGDKTPDRAKVVGQTGGIYYAESTDLENLLNLMGIVMKNGHGGDLPENDVEALLKSIHHFRDFGDLILLGDRASPIRDIGLVEQIKRPVRIILAGDPNTEVHPDKIMLAMKTNGSIHTLEEDITNLSQLVDGQTIELYGITYAFDRGKITTSGTFRLWKRYRPSP